MKNSYEMMLLFRVSATEEQRKKVLEDIKKFLGLSGKISDSLDWGKRILTYPIKKEKEANYLLLTIQADGLSLTKLSHKLLQNEIVLRHLLVRKE